MVLLHDNKSIHLLPGVPINSDAQSAWRNFFRASQPQHRAPQLQGDVPDAEHNRNDLPFVGSDYEFVSRKTGLQTSLTLTATSFQLPNRTQSEYIDEKCECDLCCASKTGTLLMHQCKQGNHLRRLELVSRPSLWKRFEQRFELDLVQARVGLGVVSPNIIPQGAFVVEYVGETHYAEDAARRNDRRYQARFRTEEEWREHSKVYVDAFICGNESRFINQSCKPKCVKYEFNWTNSTRLGIFATNEIPPLQELTFSYSRQNRQFFTVPVLRSRYHHVVK